MIRYLKKVRELLKKFVRVQVRHIPRMENSRADALSKLAIVPQEDLDRRVPVEHLMEPLVDVNSDEVLLVMTAPSWMDPIRDYLLNEILPSDPKEASKLRARLARFALLWVTLYKRGFSTPPSQIHRRGGCQLRTERGARRHLWQLYRSSGLGRKNP